MSVYAAVTYLMALYCKAVVLLCTDMQYTIIMILLLL